MTAVLTGLAAFVGAFVGTYVMMYGHRWGRLACSCGRKHWWKGKNYLRCPNGGGEYWRYDPWQR